MLLFSWPVLCVCVRARLFFFFKHILISTSRAVNPLSNHLSPSTSGMRRGARYGDLGVFGDKTVDLLELWCDDSSSFLCAAGTPSSPLATSVTASRCLHSCPRLVARTLPAGQQRYWWHTHRTPAQVVSSCSQLAVAKERNLSVAR